MDLGLEKQGVCQSGKGGGDGYFRQKEFSSRGKDLTQSDDW